MKTLSRYSSLHSTLSLLSTFASVALVAFFLPITLVAASTITYVQGNYATPQSPQTSVSVRFNSAQVAGDLNIVVVGWNDSNAAVSSVTDSIGNVYARAVGPTTVHGALSQSIYYAKNIAAAGAGANSVTVTFSRAAVSPDIRILEYSGADPNAPLDVTAAGTGRSSTSNSGSATTTNSNDLILGANIVVTTTSGPGSGFTQRIITSPDGDIAEDRMVTATGSYSASAPLTSSGSWIMQMVALRAASSGGPTLVSIAVTPANPSITVGSQQQFTATGTYSDGSHQNLTNSATWTSSVTSVATINSSGLATGVAAGNTTIQASSGSINGSTSLTVTAAPNFSLSASPASLTVVQGNQGSSTITSTISGGFNSSITLSAAGAPSGTTVSFNPITLPAPGGGNSAMTITVGTGTPVGTYPITVTGTGGGIQRSTTVTLTVAAPSSPITYVQGNYATPQSAQTTVSVTFTATQLAGDLNVVAVGWNDSTATVTAVSDSKGNIYTRVVGPTIVNGTLSQSIYYAKNIAAAGAGANTVTVTFSQSAVAADIRICEYSGVDPNTPIDVTAAASGNSSTSSSGSATTTNPNDLIYGANIVVTSTSGPGSGFTRRMITSPDGDIVEDQKVTTAGTYSATAPLSSSGPWIMQMAALQTALGGGVNLVSIAVTPANSSIGVGNQQQFTATGTYSDGSQRNLTNSAAWTSSVTSVATINSSGLATGVAAGSTSITASLGSVYGSTTLTVTAPAPNFSISASPASLSIMQGSQGTSTITTSISGGFNSSISLSAAGAPSGTTASLSPATIPAPGAGTSTMTITVGTSTPAGTYPITVTGNGGGIQHSATVILTVTSSSSNFVLPLKDSSNKRYLVDQNGTPFLIMGDAPQSLIGNLSASDIATYIADREAVGFNAIWVNLLCASYTYCNSNGTTYDGVAPFTSGSSPSNYDLATPNSAYFSRVDSMLNVASSHNLVVFLDPIETGSWLDTLRYNGTTKAYNYGVYIGNRYKNFTNIVWLHGNDFQSWTTQSDNNLVKQVMAGIASVDSNHLQTIELDYWSSYANQDSALGSLLVADSAYTYFETYDIVLQSYNSSPTIPTYLVEANYEYENNTGGFQGVTGPYILREQAYWTMLSGGSGQLYGNHYTVTFTTNWQSFLDSPGALEIRYINQFFGNYAWWELVPDSTHTVVTAGYGTYNGSGTNLPAATYCTTSWITNGSLALTYCPNPTTLTVNMAKFSGPVTAQWFDPSNGTYTTISGSPFPNSGTHNFTTPGANHDGDPDWVLVLHM